MLGEFKAFIMRGNVVDLAVGIVIGAAFTAIVNSLVDDLITPLAGIFGTVDFSSWTIMIGQATLMPGSFVNAIISFLIVAAVVFFFVVRPMNRLHELAAEGEADVDAGGPTELELLTEIRDELRMARTESDEAPS